MAATNHGEDPLRLDRQVCFPLYAATNLITRLYRPLLDALGLTYPQYLVMLVLWENEPQTVGTLGGCLYLDSGTLTPLLKRMEAAGLLTRQRDTRDERRVIITLTQAGRGLRNQALHVPAAMADGFELDQHKLDDLRGALHDLISILGQSNSGPAQS